MHLNLLLNWSNHTILATSKAKMVLIWGHKGYSNLLGFVIQECPNCLRLSPFRIYQQGKKFTLYFIPTFSYSKKQVAVCTLCNAGFEIPNEHKQRIESILMSEEELLSKIQQAANKVKRDEEAAAARLITDAKQQTAEMQLSESETKRCLYCAEIIKAQATYCRFCHRDLQPAIKTRKATASTSKKPKKAGTHRKNRRR